VLVSSNEQHSTALRPWLRPELGPSSSEGEALVGHASWSGARRLPYRELSRPARRSTPPTPKQLQPEEQAFFTHAPCSKGSGSLGNGQPARYLLDALVTGCDRR
jgi:hypothetical protein